MSQGLLALLPAVTRKADSLLTSLVLFFVVVANESIFMDPKFYLTISDPWNTLG